MYQVNVWCCQKTSHYLIQCVPDPWCTYIFINSSSPSAAYMHQWTGPQLAEVMALNLFGAESLPEPMLAYCQLDSWEHISVKIESIIFIFIQENAFEIVVCKDCRPFCPGGDELNVHHYIIYFHFSRSIHLFGIMLRLFHPVIHWWYLAITQLPNWTMYQHKAPSVILDTFRWHAQHEAATGWRGQPVQWG